MTKSPTYTAIKSVESKYLASREDLMRGILNVSRRRFMELSSAALGAALAKGLIPPHSFQPVEVDTMSGVREPFRFAYISDSHLDAANLSDRSLRPLLRAVDDINALDPQPDFVLYGGDLAQLGRSTELELGAQILGELEAPLKMMVGEHDWYLDMGASWRALFGDDIYSFDHKGVHFVVLNSVLQEDFWSARGLSPMERMRTIAGLDSRRQAPFEVGQAQREWLKLDLAAIAKDTPLIVFSHSPLYHYYEHWNFWTKDAPEVQAILSAFDSVTVVHGHTHQPLMNKIGRIQFHGMLSTAWPWPYAPEGLPELTIETQRVDPFDPTDGCGTGRVAVHTDGMLTKLYDLWNRNPVTVSNEYLLTNSTKSRPEEPSFG